MHVRLGGSVDDDNAGAPALRPRQQLFSDCFRTADADVRECENEERRHVEPGPALLYDILAQIAILVAKRGVLRERRLAGRHEHVTLLHEVHVVERVPPALLEERGDHPRVERPQRLLRSLGLLGQVAA